MENSQERRQSERLPAKEGYFAGAYPNVGQIVNISLCGLAYNYIGMEEETVDQGDLVICGEDCLCLDDLSCRILSDSVIANESALSAFVIRRRRIQFINLTDGQKKRLEEFLDGQRK